MQLQELPAEVFHRIFSFLPIKTVISGVSLVCAHWRAFSLDEHLWKYQCFLCWGYLNRTHNQDLLETWHSYFKLNFSRTASSFLVVGAEEKGSSNNRLLDVQRKLKSNGLVNVDVINVRTKATSIEMLRNYNAVLFFSYHGFNQTHLGDTLADYVDMGGGVVLCAYTNCGQGNRLEGRWFEQQYGPISLGATSRTPNLRLGKVHFPTHPIMKGVLSFNGGDQSSHGDGPCHPNASTIAEWSNRRPLVVELRAHAGTVVALNFYPPSSDAVLGSWNSSTHGGLLLSNALHYVATTGKMLQYT